MESPLTHFSLQVAVGVEQGCLSLIVSMIVDENVGVFLLNDVTTSRQECGSVFH